MRRFAITLGLAAALAGATAAPAAAHTITPTSFDFGSFGIRIASTSQQFSVTAEGTEIDGQPQVLGGDRGEFDTSTDTSVPPASRCGNGDLDPGETCFFKASFIGSSKPGSFSATVGMTDGPSATVSARTAASPSKGKKKKCKKKGKKGAASAKKKKKKKKCKKKGKKK